LPAGPSSKEGYKYFLGGNMKRLRIMTAVVMTLSALFFGCDTGGDETSTVNVTSVTISGSGVTDNTATVAVGGTLELTATVLPDNATNKTVTWSSSDTAKATVTNAGLVTGGAVGDVTITATAGGKNASITVTVTPPVKVESVVLKKGGTAVTELILPQNGTVTLTAEVLPTNTTVEDKAITWASSAVAVATVEDGVVTWVAEGTAVITATTAGKNEDGNSATASVTVTAWGAPKLVVFNQSTSPATGTTTTLPELNADGRYVINNANPDAAFSSAQLPNTAWKDNVLVYLDSPVTGDFTMDARLNIVEFNGTPSDGAWSGAWIGAFNAPTMTDFANAAANSWGFIGARKVYSADDRMLITRNDNSGSGTAYTTDGLYTPKSWTYEYLYTISRAETTYTIQVKNPKTGAVLAEGTRLVASNYTDSLQGTVNLGVMITNCKIEISNFKVTQGETIVYQQMETGPTPVQATALALSVTGAEGGGGFDYIAPLANVPEAGIQINAAFTPVNATDDLQWAISPNTGATVSQVGLVTVTAAGEYTVTATASPSTISTTYKIKILEAVPDVQSVTISGPTEVNVGSIIVLTAEIAPVGADQYIQWTIPDAQQQFATVESDGPTGGTVTGVAEGSVTVTATSFSGASGAQVTDTYAVTVVAPKEGVIFSWNAATDTALETIASSGTRTIGDVSVVALANPVTAITEGTKGYTVANGRFVIGSTSTAATTATDTTTAGTLDLSSPFKITIAYASSQGATFQVYLNNNSSSQGNSALGNPSRIWNETEVADGDTIGITIDPSTFTTNSDTLKTGFVSLRADSSTTILITSVTIEYITE
jgi:uncharacterized protein YjdB